ncbi:MAG TPA: ADOP family duplicated permease [Opitutus sp.]|nr:ADOP family duplicated permease [Opitutus sp.]
MLLPLRQTFRRLLQERSFTFTVLLTLALCVGANVAIFAVVDAILVRPLPFPEADRLVAIHNSYPRAGAERSGASAVNYYDRREAIKAFASVALFQDGSVIVGSDGTPNRVAIARVTPEFFATLGVPLARGQAFTDSETTYGTDQVAVLTDAFWRTHFNADPAIVGKQFFNDGLPITVLGVLPPGFRFLSSRAQFFRPASHGPDDIKPDNRHSNNYQMIARLAPGANLAEAQAQMNAFNQQQIADDPHAQLLRDAGFHTYLAPLHADFVRDVRPILLLLQAAVLALLLIGGLNLVNLLLIRANGRAKEIAVRQALGAGRWHLLREVMLETVVLSLGGGVLGLLIGAFGIDLLTRLGTDRLPLGGYIALDARIATVALLASLAVGILLALPVAFFNFRHALAPVLHTESRSGTASRATQRVRHGFIVTQISLAFILLSGAGLLGLTLRKILNTSPGFQANHVITGSISLPWKTYPDAAKRQAFLDRLDAALRIQPGVTSVGFTSSLPFSDSQSDSATSIEGLERAPGDSIRTHYTSFAFGDYWRALNIPLLEGRLLEPADNQRSQRVCVVDAEFARRYWPGESAIGRRIAQSPTLTEENATTIVGVVGTVKQVDLSADHTLGAVYFPYKDYSSNSFFVALRTPLEPSALAATLRKTILSIDPGLPIDNIKPMQTWVDDSLVSRRSPAVLAGAFAVVALLLAAVGTYGVLAYAVSQRRREIGVRMALGALPQQILRQFLSLGARLLLVGLALGVLGAYAAGQAMQNLLVGVGAADPVVLVASAAAIGIVVLFATFLPSRRATRVDPMIALRAE